MKLLIFFVIALLFVGCGGDTGASLDTWGIDSRSGIPIPVCNGDQTSTTNAITIPQNTQIEKTITPTVLRIWHYQSGIKKICVIQGKAIIDG